MVKECILGACVRVRVCARLRTGSREEGKEKKVSLSAVSSLLQAKKEGKKRQGSKQSKQARLACKQSYSRQLLKRQASPQGSLRTGERGRVFMRLSYAF